MGLVAQNTFQNRRPFPPNCWVSCWLPILSWWPCLRASPTESPASDEVMPASLEPPTPALLPALLVPSLPFAGVVPKNTRPNSSRMQTSLSVCFLGQPTRYSASVLVFFFLFSTTGLNPKETVFQVFNRMTECACRMVSGAIRAN